MKNSLFVLAGYLIVCTACTNELENSNKIYFYTQDSLYKISFDKPIELDTFYSWLDYDDNACSDEHKYRIFRHKKRQDSFGHHMRIQHIE